MPATRANVSDGLRDRLRGRYESRIGVSVVQIRRRDKTVPKTTLNAQNLEALGAARLAELLIELSQGYATAKRRLRMGAGRHARHGRAGEGSAQPNHHNGPVALVRGLAGYQKSRRRPRHATA